MALLAAQTFAGCGNNNSTPDISGLATDSTMLTMAEAIDTYLTDTIGSLYTEADITVPVSEFVDTTATSYGDTLRVLGDFHVYRYRLAGDTLRTVSGGAHPGLFLLARTDGGYRVARFESVEDGAGNEASARRIFGQHYARFHEISSNHLRQDSLRLQQTARYARQHGLHATHLQDQGWPAVPLP